MKRKGRGRENGIWIVSNSSEQRRRDLFLQEFFLFFTSVPHCRESDTTGKKTKGIGISRTNWTITYIPISTCVLEDGARSSIGTRFPLDLSSSLLSRFWTNR